MSPYLVLVFIGLYFGLLLLISWITGRKAGNAAFFIGNRKSHWYLVALGLIGDSLSGVTYISVPGKVESSHFSYFQIVLGYFFGYMVISHVLLPIYYRLQLVSIYSYLRSRFGPISQKTGSFYFLLSRLLGAAGRLYLAVGVIQFFVFDGWGIPFELTVIIMIALMVAYTYRGGIKTLVWTDSLQSVFLLVGLVLTLIVIGRELGLSFSGMVDVVNSSPQSQIFFWDVLAPDYFWKQFIGGAFIAICMTGLDQNMMQKNMSCPRLIDAQKNIYGFSIVMIFVNLLFLSLGVLLYYYYAEMEIALPLKINGSIDTDAVFPNLALNELGIAAGLAFITGLTAATFSSADSVLATLTTSFCIDFLKFEEDTSLTEEKKKKIRQRTHIVFAVLLFLVIIAFRLGNNKAVIDTVLKVANYTYGPLLGLFAYGIFTRRSVREPLIPVVAVLAPVLCYLLDMYSARWLGGYRFGHELLVVNGLITFTGLWLTGSRKTIQPQS